MTHRNRARVLLVTPNEADGNLATTFLQEAGIAVQVCGTLAQTPALAQNEIGCMVLVEESLVEPDIYALQRALTDQPAWSDLPLLLIAGEETSLNALVERVFPHSGNVSLLQRPLHPVALVSAIQVGLRARERQFEVRDLLEQRTQALRQRDEFLAMLGHELRNPLAPVRNAVYLLNTLFIEDPLFIKTRELIERQVTHMTRLVDDLLEVSRLELGKVELRTHTMDVTTALASASEACAAAIAERDQSLALRLPDEPLLIEADPVRVEQIASNLISNAIKFTPRGGDIIVEAARDGQSAMIAVEDNGIGIKPELLDAIFDLFRQDVSTLARSQGGLGIGLTVVKRLVELHHGSVRALSGGIGKGARFEARIPLASPAQDAEAQLAPDARAQAGSMRVLVVEDNLDIRESLRMLLALWNHQVAFATTGPEGITSAATWEPDVALIDIGLPGCDGYDVARCIRANQSGWARRVKLVAMTGYGQPSDRERALEAGFDMHLLKPVDPDVLRGVFTGVHPNVAAAAA